MNTLRLLKMKLKKILSIHITSYYQSKTLEKSLECFTNLVHTLDNHCSTFDLASCVLCRVPISVVTFNDFSKAIKYPKRYFIFEPGKQLKYNNNLLDSS